jgi:hypothetical protein
MPQSSWNILASLGVKVILLVLIQNSFGGCGWVWSLYKGLPTSKQALYHLSYASSPFFSDYFEDGGLMSHLLASDCNPSLLSLSSS